MNELSNLPTWSPSPTELDDLEVLLLGGYSPLRGFLGTSDIAAVLGTGTLADAGTWPVPITLTVSAEVADRAVAAGGIELLDEEGTPVARVKVTETWSFAGRSGVAGDVVALRLLERGSHRALRRPAGAAGDGTSSVLGIPLRHLLHSPAAAAVRIAAVRLDAAVLLLPLTGHGSPRGVPGDGLVRATLAVADGLRAGGLDVEVVPVSVPHHSAGDEAEHVLAALVARAYGATHVPAPLPRRDGLPESVALPSVVQDLRSATWDVPEVVPTNFRGPLTASEVPEFVGTAVARGEPVPAGLTSAVAVRELHRRFPGGRAGMTVLFTGLSGSGKSTLAKAVHAALLERTDRTVTLLDGDVVRRMLSAGLTFSRADRELNVRRIGYVASEITHHGGIALCAPIAPYAAVRAEVRAMVEEFGRFVLIHVNTPLTICETRDRKGLYARARRGEIPHFTGISDPYEEPLDADLTIDTSVVPLERAVEDVLTVLAVSPSSWTA